MLERLKGTLIDFIRQADLILLGLCCTATIFGMVLIASASNYQGTRQYVIVQGAAMCIGICFYILLSTVDVELLLKHWKLIFVFNIVFILLLRTPLGVSRGGNRAWLHIPYVPVNIGPAEFVKITFILLLAKQLEWLRNEKHDLKSPTAALFVGGHLLVIVGLYVVVSSDMGNASVFVFIFLCMTFLAGVAFRWYLLCGGMAAVGIVALLEFDLMPDRILKRFRILFDHSYDTQGVGWQQTRGLLALGSGQLFGQGLFNGTQTQSSASESLPERWTDLIFSAAGEELGFVGCLAIIALLCAIIIRCLVVARRAESLFDSYVCVGIAAMVMFQSIANIGMCLFVMPVIGLTLPFFSYGGSSIVTLYISMGIVSGIKKRSIRRLFGSG